MLFKGHVCALAALLTSASAVLAPAEVRADAASKASEELDAAYALKAAHRYADAEQALERARSAGANKALVELELGYLAATQGDAASARRHYSSAAQGSELVVGRRARLEMEALAPVVLAKPEPGPSAVPLSKTALEQAYKAKAAGDLVTAEAAFQRAKAAGADPQLVAMELGYLAESSGDPDEARARFDTAAQGPNAELCRLRAAGARGPTGAPPRGPLCGCVRVESRRGRVQRQLGRPYLARSRTLEARTLGSRRVLRVGSGDARHGLTRIRWGRTAADLRGRLRDHGCRCSRPPVEQPGRAVRPDGARFRPSVGWARANRGRRGGVRAGGLFYADTAGCTPAPEATARASLRPCGEAYAEAVFATRFDDNVIGFVRPRVGFGYLVTGPVAWQVMAEARAAKDGKAQPWNNFADGGVGHRWRLLAPFRLDLMISADAGSYFGPSDQAAPSRRGYVDARGVASTYMEF